jgi:hypothetical protein
LLRAGDLVRHENLAGYEKGTGVQLEEQSFALLRRLASAAAERDIVFDAGGQSSKALIYESLVS